VAITNNTEVPLFLGAPHSNNRMFSAQLVTNQPGRAYQLKISTVPPLGLGSIQGQIVVNTTWTNPPTIPVTVVANVQPAVMVMPTFMTLAPGPLPNAITNSVTIQNNSTNRLTLSDPVVNMPGVEAMIRELRPGKSFAAMLAFPQGFQVPPGQQVELSVKSSNPKVPIIKVPVMQMTRLGRPTLPGPPAAAVHAPAPASAPVPASPAPAAPPVSPLKKLSPVGAKPNLPPSPPLPPLPPAPK
jgi:hypothetical protein